MQPYRVLLVDDEEDIRVGISRKMDWESLGFSLVGEAENGQEALELAEQLRPDVVLTDIRMPFMDGLELCRILTRSLPAARFVLFSGFDDFEYAKQAIQMNVFEYILKPISAQELSEVLDRLKKQLDAHRAEVQNLETLRRQYEESLPILRELFYTQLLDGRIRAEQAAARAARYDIDLSGCAWTVGMAQFDSPDERGELLALSVRAFLEDNLYAQQGCTCRAFLYGDSVALLAGFDHSPQMYRLTEEVNRVCKLAKSYLNLTLTVGVGLPCTAIGEIPLAAAGARSALDYRVLVGAGRAIYIGDLEPDSGTASTFDENDERELVGAVKLGTPEEVRAVVSRLAGKIREAGLALPQCHLFFLELFTSLLRLTRGAGLEMESVFGEGFTGAVQITDFDSIEELENWCVDRCLRIHELLGRRRTDSTGRTVEKAKAFIEGHYAETDLSVETLCAYLHLSPAYFSTLFTWAPDMSFTAYVTQVRMEHAADLLRNSEDKTYLIAEKTGYLDPNYFSYVFKKHFGLSPTRFRGG